MARRRRRSWHHPGLAVHHGLCCPLTEVYLPPRAALLSLPIIFLSYHKRAGTVKEFYVFLFFAFFPLLFLSLYNSLGFDRGEEKSLEPVEIAQQQAVNKHVIESPRRKYCLSDLKFHLAFSSPVIDAKGDLPDKINLGKLAF